MPPSLADRQGHLTPAGLAALTTAPPGRAPKDLATHVASCASCQERILTGSAAGASSRRERRTPPPPWRIWVVLGAGLALLLSILATIHRLR
jgi:hypothetical protein